MKAGLLIRKTPINYGGFHGMKLSRYSMPATTKTFYPLLFNGWARSVLEKEISSKSLFREEASIFFRLIRRGEYQPPYKIAKYNVVFISDFMSDA
jgi:hypothetical protein